MQRILGAFNTWADHLTRWTAPGNEESPARRLSALRAPLTAADLPKLPFVDVISKSQLALPPPSNAGFSLTSTLGSDICMTKNGKIYIREKDDYMQLRIRVPEHCGLRDHRGLTDTTSIVKEKQYLSTIESDAKAFVQTCLVCTLYSRDSKIPRPLGQKIQAQLASEVLHFDFLYAGKPRSGH